VLPTVLAGLVLVGCGATPAPAPAVVPAALATATATAPATATAAASDPGDVAPPARIRLPSLGVDTAVVAVGVDARGEMAVPEDVRETGWYRFGPAPGSAAGSSVVSGHVDDRVQGRGAFYRLVDLAVGDPVVVTTAAGADLAFRVSAVRRIPKSTLPVDELFARDGPPHLTLVTCGGTFDRALGSYRDNVVVTAVSAP
jgi:sortase (surface protein transpeptidase)